jgi:hypothetical protein
LRTNGLRTAIVPLQDKVLPAGLYSLRSEFEAIEDEYENIDESVADDEQQLQAWSKTKRKVLETREKVRSGYWSPSG